MVRLLILTEEATMPNATRLGDMDTGHDACAPTAAMQLMGVLYIRRIVVLSLPEALQYLLMENLQDVSAIL